MLRQESACTHLYIYFHHTLETHCSLCPERDQLACSSGHVTKDHTHAVLMVSLREQTHCSHGDWVSLREHLHCSHGLPQRTDTLFLWPPSENRHANLMVSLREQTCHSRRLPQRTIMSFSSSPSENRHVILIVSLREQTHRFHGLPQRTDKAVPRQGNSQQGVSACTSRHPLCTRQAAPS